MVTIKVLEVEEGKTTLNQWLITGPFHPHWNRWVLSLVSLADFEDYPPANKEDEKNTHELIILAVEPNSPDGTGDPEFEFLSSPDMVFQFEATDAQAQAVGEAMIRLIETGQMSPDSDYRGRWAKILPGIVKELCG